ncbi:MAG: hypothetical protein ACTSXP_05450 [Promethearchaeota archaeon]
MKMDYQAMSIESYAQRFKRYHPVILKTFLAIYKKYPREIERIFKSKRDLTLFLNSFRNTRVYVLNTRKIISGRRPPAKRKNYFLIYHRFFPRKFKACFRSGRDMNKFIDNLRKLEINELSRRDQLKGSSLTPDKDSLESSTPCFMVANHAVWVKGVLNKPGYHLGNTFDLSTVEGFVLLLHEIYHNMQWFRSPLRLLFQYLSGFVNSVALSDGHITWAHEVIDFEMEAIIFHTRLKIFMYKHSSLIELLSGFKKYQ